jgi:hypothetical protein
MATTRTVQESSGTPRMLGLALSAVLALGMTAIGFVSAGKAQALLTVVHLAVGPLALWLTWKAYRRSRAGWAFLVSMQSVLTIYYLFGAPTFTKLLGVSIPVAMIPAALYAAAATALILARRDYT